MFNSKLKIGVLALQGSFIEHVKKIEEIGIECIEVRQIKDLKKVHGLIIPGGESTVISKLLKESGLFSYLKNLILKEKFPVYGTCAGSILLAKKISGKTIPTSLNVFDMDILRNAYGSQLASFIEEINIPKLNIKKFPAVFIRAPLIKNVGKNVEILSKRKNGQIIMARQSNLLVSTFHPELVEDTRVHEFFAGMCEERITN